MTSLQFSEDAFLKAAAQEEDFTNLSDDSGFERGAESFLKSFYSDTLENEFLNYSLSDLIQLARDFWMAGNRRKAGDIIVSVKTAPTCCSGAKPDTAIQVIADNMSFLVDSLVAAVSSFGVNVSGLFHPIVEGWRDEDGKWGDAGEEVLESMILIMVPPQTQRNQKRLEDEVKKTIDEVQIINSDFLPLVQNVRATAEELKHFHGKTPKEDVDEAVAFLDWLADGNFVLFGARRYDYMKTISGEAQQDYVNPYVQNDQSLGLLRDPDLTILRQSSEPSAIASNVERFVLSGPPVSVAKSNIFTRVHRRVRMDYVSVKHFNKLGKVSGETRYIGLFTSDAYNRSPAYVPLIRQKVSRIMERSNWPEGSHNAKRLEYVLASYPRDELFQIENDDLLRIATGVAQAFDRPRTRIFVRRDPFERFVSVLVYVQQEHYNTRVRKRIGERLKDAFGGRLSAFYPQYSDAPMARVHFIIGMNPDEGLHPDLADLEAEIAQIAQPWFDGVQLIAEETSDLDVFGAMLNYDGAFSVAYQDMYSCEQAVEDIIVCESLTEDSPLAVKVYDTSEVKDGLFKTKIYQHGERLEPSRIMPVFSHFDCHIVEERGFEIERKEGVVVWVHDYEVRLNFQPEDTEKLTKTFESAFLATWKGQNEDDAFNRLILPQNANWRDIAFLRLIARYRRQSGLDPSESTQIEALELYPELTGQLLAMKTAKFDPDAFSDMSERKEAVSKIEDAITKGLSEVSSLEHDRVIRRMADAISAGLRTNFYQHKSDGQIKPYISLKIKSDDLDNLPAPRPYREIYVSSPQIEGVHLRFGPVARGGLRWSDRRDDFRTEVLGLVKAQQVKNAVIVPVGSKGGFYPKQLPKGGSRDDVQAEAISAYKTFISGILDLTDNYEGQGTVPPSDVVCWDEPDPYLVVAADKGTATFSDIANSISQDYGFWLDDAFASGGSVGYDHKVMGITARGGWEAVKRHFREVGKDIQSEPFTVVGVGDMSGDVFGNGMLLSKHIKLVAAFNHLDIFIDPDPDAQASFEERQRMFELPRSTWQDYNKDLISKGGGVFSRQEKAISLSPEIQNLTGLNDDSVTPNQLMKALLKSDVELLWFGGIGTYIKSQTESHTDVSDKANDPIRVNGEDVKAKVVGEGANLGLTQAGRIEFARSGGRINTDAIDNSAGVDSSDNEVNIKILLGGAIDKKSLKREDRDELLASMTDDVARLVLQHNYDQTGILSLVEMRAKKDHDAYERLMTTLERRDILNRLVEGLPGTEAMQALASQNKTLTRPELSVLIAYSKNVLFDDLITTDVADDPFMMGVLQAYFPEALHKFEDAMEAHRLKREIITSRLINQIIDVCGPVFMMRLQEQTQGSLAEIAQAFIVAYETLKVGALREDIAALDNRVNADAQLHLHNQIAIVMQRVVAWLVRSAETGSISERIELRSQLSGLVDSAWLDLLSPYDRRRAEKRVRYYTKLGVPEALATDVALLKTKASGFDVMSLSNATGWGPTQAAALFYDIGGRFKIDRVRSALINSESESHWERLALRHLQEDFFKAQVRFAQSAAAYHANNGGEPTSDVNGLIQKWVSDEVPQVKAYEDTVSAMSRAGGWTVSKFAIINAQLSDLISNL